MSYAALMVYVEPDEAPEGRVRLAAGLADKFGAALIGLSARSIAPPILANGLMMPSAPDINALQRQLADRGSWFGRIADSNRRKTEWRCALELANQMVTREARSADLVVIGQAKGWASKFDPLDPGAAILRMGRPTLVVPKEVSSLSLEHAVIGWKDTREARRAVQDSLPLLQKAARITIFEACGPDEEKSALARLDDVVRYLALHRIKSGPMVMVQKEGSGAAQLLELAKKERADLLVTGAYGHTRLGEWIFGGMTQQLLATSPICCLMSH